MENTRELLRPADVAPLLGVGRGRIYQLVATGVLPTVRRGRTILIPRAAWERWLADQASRALDGIKRGPETPGPKVASTRPPGQPEATDGPVDKQGRAT